jgi:hypothetical protein
MAHGADWISIVYDLEVNIAEDRGGDEPRLQFLFVTADGGRAAVDIVDTGRLGNSIGSGQRLRGQVSSGNVPSRENPFLGVIVRALEDDSSRSSDRNRDRDRLELAVREKAQELLQTNRLNSDELWVSANNAPLVDRIFRDEDDKIGVSLRRYLNFGIELADAVRNDNGPITGTIRGFAKEFLLRFIEDEANYVLRGRIFGAFLT